MDKDHQQQNGSQRPLLLRGTEVAAALGISRALAYRWMQDRTLPALHAPAGRMVRVPRAALEEWIEKYTCTGKGGGGHE